VFTINMQNGKNREVHPVHASSISRCWR